MNDTVILRMADGNDLEVAWEAIVGDFAIHRIPGYEYMYQITHVPSGRSIYSGNFKHYISGWDSFDGAAKFAALLVVWVNPGDIYEDDRGEWVVKPEARMRLNALKQRELGEPLGG
jgi:hypothetical protein